MSKVSSQGSYSYLLSIVLTHLLAGHFVHLRLVRVCVLDGERTGAEGLLLAGAQVGLKMSAARGEGK